MLLSVNFLRIQPQHNDKNLFDFSPCSLAMEWTNVLKLRWSLVQDLFMHNQTFFSLIIPATFCLPFNKEVYVVKNVFTS